MEDSDMNTDVQKNHRVVVGAGVALIAAAGISVLAIDVHREAAKPTPSAVPAAIPDTSAAALNQTPDTAPPPPMVNGAPLADSAPAAAASVATASTAPTASPQPSAAAPKSARQASTLAAGPQRSSAHEAAASPPMTQSAPKPKVAEVTAMATVPASAPARNNTSDTSAAVAGASSPAQSDISGGSNAGTIQAMPGATDSPSLASGNAAPSANGAPAASGGEVTTTMQARAAGADSVNADRIITSAVQSQIAADTSSQGANLAVTTINGVVILTGTVPSADAVEHVKQVVQQVNDVKGVDATAVRVSGS